MPLLRGDGDLFVPEHPVAWHWAGGVHPLAGSLRDFALAPPEHVLEVELDRIIRGDDPEFLHHAAVIHELRRLVNCRESVEQAPTAAHLECLVELPR